MTNPKHDPDDSTLRVRIDLDKVLSDSDKPLSSETEYMHKTPPEDIRPHWGTATFKGASHLLIQLPPPTKNIASFPIKSLVRITIGRGDPNTQYTPDIDLEKHGFKNRGISRRHVSIEIDGDHIIVVDLESTNGTYLNGLQLLPNQPRILRNDDELMLADVPLRIYIRKKIAEDAE